MEAVLNSQLDKFTEEDVEAYLLAIYSGLITTNALSVDYHEKIGGTLYNGVLKGWGAVRFNEAEQEILAGLTENIYVFSAAKQYQQVREMEEIIKAFSKAANELIPYSEFKKGALEIFETYNQNWLRTEYNTAIAQSQNAKKWAKIQAEKEIFPLLQYKTQNDGLVREAHAQWHNVIKPVNDPFWINNMPTNGWNCRCFTQQIEEGEVSENVPELTEDEQPELFKMNAGRDKLIFDPNKHPYFSVARGDAALRDDNFNLPKP